MMDKPVDAWSFILFPAAGGIVMLALANEERLLALLRPLGRRMMRQRAALAICLGLAVVAFDWLLFRDVIFDEYWRDLHRQGWIAFAGFAAALVGIYHWIAGPRRDEL